MVDPTNFKATVSEWRLVLNALKSYKSLFESKVDAIEDEDLQNEIYDDLERLERLIPDFQAQFDNKYNIDAVKIIKDCGFTCSVDNDIAIKKDITSLGMI